jgi:sugar phosphate isomerase/epimerase
MLDLTAAAEVNGTRFDGVDLFLAAPHFNIDSTLDDVKTLADKLVLRGLVAGSVVAPIWPATGGGSAMGNADERRQFVEQVRKACVIAQSLRKLRIRQYGVVRIDSAASCTEWLRDPQENTTRIVKTFREACDVAEDNGEHLAAEGEICWGGMHSWRRMVQLLEMVARPRTLGFQADMAHTLLYALGYNAPEDRILPTDFDWSDGEGLRHALLQLTDALRPWTTDLHVAQNDASVKGMGTHDKTGHHCLPFDPAGKLDLARDSGYWLRDRAGNLTKQLQHICWDGCMFSNTVLLNESTWQDVLSAMIAVRVAHGWDEAEAQVVV